MKSAIKKRYPKREVTFTTNLKDLAAQAATKGNTFLKDRKQRVVLEVKKSSVNARRTSGRWNSILENARYSE